MDRRLLVAAALLASAIVGAAAFGRYEIAATDGVRIYRVDRLTGHVEACNVMPEGTRAATAQPTWCAAFKRPIS